jgi:hypothetical protein
MTSCSCLRSVSSARAWSSSEMDAMEKILDHAGLPPTELQHIRRQLHAVEELMKDIQAETK